MKTRERVGLSIAPLFLRLGLGIIFVWAGLAKLVGQAPYPPDQLVTLANMGASIPPEPQPGPSTITPGAPRPPSEIPVPRPPGQPMPAPVNPGGGGAWLHPRDLHKDNGASSIALAAAHRQSAPPSTGASATPPPPAVPGKVYTEADFPVTRELKPLYQIALMLKARSQPPPDKPNIAPLVPPALGRGSTPLYLAWGAAITEFLAGAMLLVGLFTRLAALSLACVVLVAAWLTQIGPAVAGGTAMLGFLPDHPWHNVSGYATLWLQLSLFMMAMAVVFIGPGGLSLDGAFASSPGPSGGGSGGKPPPK